MRKPAQVVALFLLALLALLPAHAQKRRDPLTEHETDLLRQASFEPAAKIKLYIQFAHARMDAAEQARADSTLSPQERGRKIHDALENLESIVDELSDNVESFAKRGWDMRKPLRGVISMDSDFRARLGALKQQASAPALAQEYQQYQFVLDDTLDSVKSIDETAHDLLAEQDQAAERRKKK